MTPAGINGHINAILVCVSLRIKRLNTNAQEIRSHLLRQSLWWKLLVTFVWTFYCY